MDFTALFPHSSHSSSVVSSDGLLVLTAVGDRLIVRDSRSMKVIRSWKSTDQEEKNITKNNNNNNNKNNKNNNSSSSSSSSSHQPIIPSFSKSSSSTTPVCLITSISFSPDSQSVCALLRSSTNSLVFIYSIHSDQLVGQINIGAEGVASGDKAIRWSPSGNSLIVWSDWNLRVTIWPLSSSQPKPLQLHHPKHGPNIGSAFSPTGRYFALLCRQPGNYQDHVGVYDTISWSCASLFALSTELVDPTHLHWSPCGRYLAIVESALLDYRLEVWSPTGSKLGVFTPQNPKSTTDQLHASSPNNTTHPTRADLDALPSDPIKRKDLSESNNQESDLDGYVGLGIRHIKWSPAGEYLAVGGWDSKVRLLNDLTWTTICVIDLNEITNARVLNEPRDWIVRTRGHGIIPFEEETTSILPTPLKPDYNKPNPTIGVKEIEWSAKGDYMACRNDALPTVVFIFSFKGSSHSNASSTDTAQSHCAVPLRPRLSSILNFALPVKNLQWHPTLNQLLIVCATSAVYSWYPSQPGASASTETQPADYCEGIGVPAGIPFHPVSVKWTPTGSVMLLSDKIAFCLAFPVPDEEVTP